MDKSNEIMHNTGETISTKKEEITLKFNINNVVTGINKIKKWTNFSDKDFLNKPANEIFDSEILSKYTMSIELVKEGNIEYLNYQNNNYYYQVLLSPYYQATKYDGFIAIITRFKNLEDISDHSNDYYSIFDDNKKCVVIFETDNKKQDFIIKSFNHSAEKLEKVNRFDVIGKNVVDVFPGIKDFGLLDTFKRVVKSGESEKLEPIYYKDKRVEGYRVNSVFKFSENKIIVIYNDITEEKELENKLNASPYEFDLVNNLETEGIIFVKNDIIIKVNQKAIDIFGFNYSSEIIGNQIYEYVNTKYHNLLRKYLEINKGEKFNILGKHKRNIELLIEGYAKKITYGEYGKIDIFFIKDITKETENNKKLKLLSAAVEQSANSVVITNKEGIIEYVNPYFTSATGYSQEEAIDHNFKG